MIARLAPCPDSDLPDRDLTQEEANALSAMADEYRAREIEEGITPHDLSADDADWNGYASQWSRR